LNNAECGVPQARLTARTSRSKRLLRIKQRRCQDEYSARGASAIIDAVRSARIINSLGDKDARLLGG
jgi:hypothetical protein